jgi:hypothetical protein
LTHRTGPHAIKQLRDIAVTYIDNISFMALMQWRLSGRHVYRKPFAQAGAVLLAIIAHEAWRPHENLSRGATIRANSSAVSAIFDIHYRIDPDHAP